MDIRLPIGAMFTIFGLMLSIYGVATKGDAMYQKSDGIDINVYWGLLMLVFGVLMLVGGLMAKPQPPKPGDGHGDGHGH
jgi:uncharacterized membrane protein HdeD (DUF308 family)